MLKIVREPMSAKDEKRYPNYGRVAIGGLKKSRKGKHHGLLQSIMEDLRGSAPGFAVKVPLGRVSVMNLRSAIVRAAAREKISIATSSDDENFYVWKA
jgi:glyceraldehyde-3-phosphate dehydrogenase/erythrose-4-phosphate dehydrogenase